jgi:hypothetical protein
MFPAPAFSATRTKQTSIVPDLPRAHARDASGRATYRLRQQVVEPVFGQIKNKGLIRLLLRGEENCRAEWLLHSTGHNLCKLRAVWG